MYTYRCAFVLCICNDNNQRRGQEIETEWRNIGLIRGGGAGENNAHMRL